MHDNNSAKPNENRSRNEKERDDTNTMVTIPLSVLSQVQNITLFYHCNMHPFLKFIHG